MLNLKMHQRSISHFSFAALLLASCGLAHGAGLADQWYVGIGGGASLVQPDPILDTLGVDVDESQSATLFVGRDINSRLSGQLQFSSFGEATMTDDTTIPYNGLEASMLYRFVDSRNRPGNRSYFGASLFGRAGLGIVDRDTDIDLRSNTPISLAGGLGVEIYLSRYFALRAEGNFHAHDLASATISLVGRFGSGGLQQLPPASFGNQNSAPADTQEAESTPAPSSTAELASHNQIHRTIRRSANEYGRVSYAESDHHT